MDHRRPKNIGTAKNTLGFVRSPNDPHLMILLANSFFVRNDPKQLERMKPYPPLATLLVAAALRERGHEVALFDATLANGVGDFVALLEKTRPAVVGILEDNFNYLTKMCTTRTREATIEMVAAAAAMGCRVAVNGSDSSDHPMPYLEAGAHAVLRAEADVSFVALAEAWRVNPDAPVDAIPGLLLRDENGVVTHTAGAASVGALDALPFAAWDLIDVESYRLAWTSAHGRLSWNMVASRGCPFGCNWCAKPIFGRRYVQRSPQNVAREMRELKIYVRPDHIWFADDIFGLTENWILEFAEAVERLDAKIPFMMQCRADLLTPAVAHALAAAGAEEVWLGVESGAQHVLNAMEKGTTVDEIREATRSLKAAGIRACWFLQLGYPGEEWTDILATRNLVRDERPDDIGVSVAYPLPGTKFHETVRAQLGLHQHWEHSDDLAMLFRGAYSTALYRQVRDVLHDETRTGANDERWTQLEREASLHLYAGPLILTGV
jgi:anaerobic magnesium-protoporphyrin IX monomethyl ester cyclase